MNDKPRYVFDTNVLVSASLFKGSTSDRSLHAARTRGNILLSKDTGSELTRVLLEPRFDRYLSRAKRQEFLTALTAQALSIETTVQILASRDRDDNKFLDLAAEGRAGHVVTGDQDLLILDPFRGIRIVTPAQFLTMVADD